MTLPYLVTIQNGDWAEAETVEGIVCAGRTLYDDAVANRTAHGGYPVINFYYEGQHIHSNTDRKELNA